jgi:hypothetical protein
MWFLEPEAHGNMKFVTLANQAVANMISTLEVWGGPWALDGMDVRSLGGIALKAAKNSTVWCTSVGIGGLDGGEKDEFGNWIGSVQVPCGHESRSHFGVHLFDVSVWCCHPFRLCLAINSGYLCHFHDCQKQARAGRKPE